VSRTIPVVAVALLLAVATAAATVGAVDVAGLTNDFNNGVETNEPVEVPVRGISYVAFCAAGEYGTGQLSFSVSYDDEGEPVEIDWTSDVPLTAVVIKSSTYQLTFEYPGGATSGTVGPAVQGGTLTDEPNSDPCPGGDLFGYKYEADSDFEDSEQVDGGFEALVQAN